MSEMSGTSDKVRIGIVDFDTSHVNAFTQRINQIDIEPESFVEGGKVVIGFRGDSAMMADRIPPFVEKFESYGLPVTDRLEDLLDGRIDAVMIESQQGSRHLDRARPFLEAGIPTFVDKPFAADAADADAIIALAEKYGTPLMTCSPLRYAPEVIDAVAQKDVLGKVVSADAWSTCILHEGNPGLLHYGCHGVETLYALMGTGCKEVRTVYLPGGEVTVGTWDDGRIGTMRGIRDGQGGFGFAAHYEKGHVVSTVKGAAFYSEMLKRVMGMFNGGPPPIPYAEIREIMAFMDAALASRESGGATVAL